MGSYGSNSTISFPGEDWSMLWPEGFPDWQLDIVGFLAILGEASILANAQVSALSRLFFLPRLLPAPQALLRVSRPATLPPVPAYVTAVVSGNHKRHVHHVASILLGTSADQMKKHWVRCVTIEKEKNPKAQTMLDWLLRGMVKQSSSGIGKIMGKDEEKAHDEPIPATVKAKAAGPLTWVTLLAVSLTVALFILSLVFGDGMSLAALITLSLLSTIVGIANKWELSLPARPKNATELHDDMVVIRYPEGSFLIVKCNDEISRELFFAPEEINYTIKDDSAYRVLALVGTLLLMLGVILLANARLELQFAWVGVYLILNAAHWAAAALPAKMHWDLSCYTVREQGIEGGPEGANFTEALWKAISITKKSRWVQQNEAAPNEPRWTKWLRKARRAAREAPEKLYQDELENPVREWTSANGKGLIIPVNKSFMYKDEFNRLEKRDEEQLSADEFDRIPPSPVLGAQRPSDGHVGNGHPL